MHFQRRDAAELDTLDSKTSPPVLCDLQYTGVSDAPELRTSTAAMHPTTRTNEIYLEYLAGNAHHYKNQELLGRTPYAKQKGKKR